LKYIGVIAVLAVLVAGSAVRPVGAAAKGTRHGTKKTWARVTAFPRPSFHAQRRIVVRSAGSFWAAWNALRPGDRITVHGVAFHGEAVFSKELSGWAEVHFDAATTFAGAAGSNLPAAWIHGANHVRFYGGNLTNPNGGSGITLDDSSYVSWWNFTIHDTANTGLFVRGITRASDHLDLKGEISHWGLNLALDPHAEKGTGLHGANLADANHTVKDSRFALYLHDGAAGSGVEAGGSKSTDGFSNNTLYLRCRHLTMVARVQVGGNCAQVWGENVTGNRFAYLQAQNLEGRPYDATGMFGGRSLASDRVGYGRASRTNLNPRVGTVRWDARHSTQFGNVSPRR
jgi:hypothetical protein